MEDFWDELTAAEKETYGKLQSVLGSPGFKIIEQDLQEKVIALQPTLQNPQSWEAHCYARGVRDGIAQLLNIEERIRLEYSQKIAERAAEVEEVEPEAPQDDFA